MGGYGDRLKRISLGQGQAQKANDLVAESCKNGNWVMLQNCHLSASYMPELENLVQGFFDQEVNPDFRLFLTSAPSPDFPVSVLQVSVKLTTEPPRGLRANIKRTYSNLNDEYLEGCSRKPEVWCKLSFGLAFFHAILQERRKFGPLGWNVRYEFNDSDLDTSQTMLKNFLMEQEDIPWDAMLYVTGAINYGGRVTDEWDQRCLNCALKTVYNEDALVDGYLYSDSGKYYAPASPISVRKVTMWLKLYSVFSLVSVVRVVVPLLTRSCSSAKERFSSNSQNSSTSPQERRNYSKKRMDYYLR